MPVKASLRTLALPFVLLAMLLSVVVIGATPSPADAARPAAKVHHAFRIAHRQIGDPYRYGAAGPGAYDCSGLVFHSYRKAGFRHIPRTSSAQAHFAHRIKRSHMRRGDLIFFTSGGGVYHVGIYTGRYHHHRWVLHAPHPGTRVHKQRLWTNAWFPATLRHHR